MTKYVSWITINRACNLRCKWCYAQSSKFSKQDDMTMECFLKIMKVISAPMDVKKIVFIGGEPTIHPNFIEMLSLAKKTIEKVSLITNGIKFKDIDFTKEVKKEGLTWVTLSLKAPNDQLYKDWTGVSAMSAVIQAIANLKKENIGLSVSLVLSSELYRYIDELAYILHDLKIDKVYIDSERPVLIGDQTVYKQSIKDITSGYHKTVDALEKYNIPYIFKASLPFCLIPEDFVNRMRKDGRLQAGCQILAGNGLIFNTNGDLLACNQICQDPLAQFDKDFNSAESLKSLLKSDNIVNFYKMIASYPHEKCSGCKDWKYCGGGCRVNWLYKNMLDNV